jgi:uridine phosphorylase
MTSKLDHLQDANFPRDPEGRVYHLGVKRGEVANRILSVGDASRAKMLSLMLDNPTNLLIISNRGFTVYTGTFQKVPITIIATGMGVAMVDFLVRECRAVVDGTMCIIRYGTCGTPAPTIKVGSVVVSDSSILVRRNPDHWTNESIPPYDISLPVPADPVLTDALFSRIVSQTTTYKGCNATADSFYSSQGRTDPGFNDHNAELVDQLVAKYPQLCTLEMETFQLMHLAHCARNKNIRATAAVMVLAQRRSNEFLDNDRKHALEALGGRACLDTLANFVLAPEETMSGPECIWNVT